MAVEKMQKGGDTGAKNRKNGRGREEKWDMRRSLMKEKKEEENGGRGGRGRRREEGWREERSSVRR